MKTLSQYLQNIQGILFPFLKEELGPLTAKQQQLIQILEIVQVEAHVPVYIGMIGRPEDSRQSLARSFIAKAVYNMPTTKILIERLKNDISLRRICGWEQRCNIPSESTFSRAFAEFAETRLPEKIHAAKTVEYQGDRIIGHISRDSTEIESREKPEVKAKNELQKQTKGKRGRPKKGEEKPKKPTRLERQSTMNFDEMLDDLPVNCDVGCKKNSKGHKETWIGYKLHIDAIDGGIPVSCILTSASVHDSQVALPLAELSNQRVTNLYDLMDAAYDSPIIKSHSEGLGHVPIIDHNPRRGGEKRKMDPPEAIRYNERSTVERVNGRLKDEFGGRFVRVKGSKKVMAHLMFGILVLTVDQMMKFVT